MDYSSFVGMHPIPIVHGMTIGEIAYMINELNWIDYYIDLRIVKMQGWERNMYFENTGKKWISTVTEQIAYFVRYMHENKFIHHDLNLRNILVQTKGYPAVYFIDCPAGGFNSGFSLERGIIRDLAHLDKVARYVLSERDLMRFYRKYKQIEKLSLKDKKIIVQIRHFHDKHRANQKRKEGKEFRVI